MDVGRVLCSCCCHSWLNFSGSCHALLPTSNAHPLHTVSKKCANRKSATPPASSTQEGSFTRILFMVYFGSPKFTTGLQICYNGSRPKVHYELMWTTRKAIKARQVMYMKHYQCTVATIVHVATPMGGWIELIQHPRSVLQSRRSTKIQFKVTQVSCNGGKHCNRLQTTAVVIPQGCMTIAHTESAAMMSSVAVETATAATTVTIAATTAVIKPIEAAWIDNGCATANPT